MSLNSVFNDSPYCTLRLTECICDLPYILFNCFPLSNKRLTLLNSLKSFNILSSLLLNTIYEPAINIIIIFILEAGIIV